MNSANSRLAELAARRKPSTPAPAPAAKPTFTKPITGKTYSGNSPKPYWLIEQATKTFGPCGIGWGVEVISDAILAKGVAAAAKFNFDNTVKVLQEGWPEAMPEK
jgi:hypothetical protein